MLRRTDSDRERECEQQERGAEPDALRTNTQSERIPIHESAKRKRIVTDAADSIPVRDLRQ